MAYRSFTGISRFTVRLLPVLAALALAAAPVVAQIDFCQPSTGPFAISATAATEFEGDVGTDGAGNWIAVWSSDDPTGGGGSDTDIWFARSSDNSETWSAPQILNSNAATDSGSDVLPRIDTDGSGNWVVSWSSNDTLGGLIGADFDILYSRSTDFGTTWSPVTFIDPGATAEGNIDQDSKTVAAPTGTIVVAWEKQGGPLGIDADIIFTRSTDGGVTWSPPTFLNSNAGSDTFLDDDFDVELAGDPTGLWVAVWELNETIYFARSTTDGQTWSMQAALEAQPVFTSTKPDVATDNFGSWTAVWSTTNPAGGNSDEDIVFSSSGDGINWSLLRKLDDANDAIGSTYIADLSPSVAVDGGNWFTIWNVLRFGQTSISEFGYVSRGEQAGQAWSPHRIVYVAGNLGEQWDPQFRLVAGDQGVFVAVFRSTPFADSDFLAIRILGNCLDCDEDGYGDPGDATCTAGPERDCRDTSEFCSTDCTDVDGDLYCVTDDCDDTLEFCREDCTDDDADGVCVAFDCDEMNPNCGTTCIDRDDDGWCSGVDCDDFNENCTSDCTDADSDTFCADTDCDDANPACRADCADADEDGACVELDCDDANPNCVLICGDADMDAYCADVDCDDAKPGCTTDCTDPDGDGFCGPADCDESNALCNVSCVDADGDGACVGVDCNDANPSCDLDCTDADLDGFCITTDCDDTQPGCALDCTDADADGVAACAGDCDDTSAVCTFDCSDADEDGVCADADCAPANPGCNVDCTDIDGDAFCPPADCDDTDDATNPMVDEICDDGIDNDCDGFIDDEESTCSNLTVSGLGFAAGKSELSWNVVPDADGYGLYRGRIPSGGFVGYNHLCDSSQVTGTLGMDPDTPPRGEGFYYIVAGQDVGAGPTFTESPLGTSSSGAERPESTTISCGARVYVDPDVVGTHNGLSWATAYTGVSRALLHEGLQDRGLEVWVRGTVADLALGLTGAVRPGVRVLGGFAGGEAESWQRDPDTTPTVWSGPGPQVLLQTSGVSVVLDGMTVSNAASALKATGEGTLVEVIDVDLEQMGSHALDLTFSGSGGALYVEGSSFDGSGAGMLHAKARAGLLTGALRFNTIEGGSQTAIRLEAASQGADVEMSLDVIGNRISGGQSGIALVAQVDDAPASAVQSSFVASNLVHATTGPAMLVVSEGNFLTATSAASAVARPLVLANTLSDAGTGGLVSRATRTDSTGDPSVHEVRAQPEIWDNLITSCATNGIEESMDDEPTNLISDPASIVGNGLFGNTVLYLDEGVSPLTTPAEVDALPGAADTFVDDPLYADSGAGDFHLATGSPAIDTGHVDAPRSAKDDFEDDGRPRDGDGNGIGGPDVGADER